jgi:hypothetical protein
VGGELGRGEQEVRSILSAAFMAVCIYMRGVSKPSAFRKQESMLHVLKLRKVRFCKWNNQIKEF